MPTTNNPNYDMRQYGNAISRGYRNNNPLNIDENGTKWQGRVAPSQDKRFVTFGSLPWGYRAAMVTMRTYITKYGLNTIFQIINRWAPASDGNYPVSYAANVCRIINEQLGGNVTPDTVVAKDNRDLLTKMAYAMSIVENGKTHKYTNNGKEVTINLKETYGLPNMNIINEAWRLI